MKLGAIHRPAPAAVQPLHARASLSLLTAPAAVDWHKLYPADGDALGNLTTGCCVEAAMFNATAMRRANAWHDERRPNADLVAKLYAELTGFDPVTEIPDDGTDTVDAMAAWCKIGIWLDQQTCDLVQWCTVDRLSHVNSAIATTGPVQITLNLPMAAQDVATWTTDPTKHTDADWVPGSWGQHRVCSGKYDGDALTVRTWGKDVAMHPAWFARYVLAVDCTLSGEWFDQTGLSPPGLDRDALTADMRALAA